jgi:tricorn protease
VRLRGSLFATLIAACAFWLVPCSLSAQDQTGTPSFGEPGISPDHSEIAFVSGGDIWSVAAEGGTARLLASTGGNSRRPLFSPDGKRLAFISSRAGANGIYVMTLADGAVTRVTHDDVTPELTGWSGDGRFVYFSTASHNIEYFNDIYKVAIEGGTPLPVIHEDFVNAMDAAPAPDGRQIAYARNGYGSQWWRHGHAHIDETQLTAFEPATRHFETLTDAAAKERWPMWSPDGATLYFVSDRSRNGSDQLWARSGGRARQLTQFGAGRVLFPSISRDGRTIAFERDLRIWTYDVAGGTTHELSIERRGLSNLTPPTHLTVGSRFSALSVSPDEKKIAFVGRGRVFAASAEGGDAQAVPSEAAAAADLPVWAHDNRTIAYVIDRGDEQALATYAFPDGPERVLTPAGHHDDYPHWAPDGQSLVFVRDGVELRSYDLGSKTDRLLAHGVMDRRPYGDLHDIAFSPAGDWIAYVDQDPGGFSNVRVVPAKGGESRALTFLPNANGGPLAWAPDGTRLYFVTGQRTEQGDVAQVDLIARTPRFREDAFRNLFGPEPRPELPTHTLPSPEPSAAAEPAASAKPARPTSTRIEFEGIRDRLTLLQTGLDVGIVAVTPDSKTLVLVANAAGETNLYTYPVAENADEPEIAKQITNTSGAKSDLTISSNGRSALLLASGRISSVDLSGKGLRPLPVEGELDVDFASDKRLVFEQAWSLLQRWYADPNFHGANWDAERARYLPFALGARSPGEFYRVVSLMIGELNSSHSGIFPPGAGNTQYLGRLGVDWDPAAYERDGRLRVTRLVPLGPLAVLGRVHAGDELLSVEGKAVTAQTDLDALLAHSIGKRTVLRFAPQGDAATAYTVLVQPTDSGTESQLRYLAWVAGRRAYVERISGGRVGYVHIADMSADSLKKFYIDLDSQQRTRQAVIVDVRNNTGGFIDPYAIDVLTRREYLTFRSRFGYDAPERTSLGQRVLDRPAALVVNEHSLSDAENFTEAFRVLKAGPIIGVPTAGWIIFTSEAGLADGSAVRLPSTRVIAHDGVDMELHPRPVDVHVDNPPGAAERGDDPQLDAAVRNLERRGGR